MQNVSADISAPPTGGNVASASTSIPSQQVHSTLTRSRIVSSTHRHETQSEDGDLPRELEQHQYSGISFQDFLKYSFDVTDDELQQILEEVRGYDILSSPAYKDQEAKFAEAAPGLERSMQDSYALMGNMILDRALQSSENLLPGRAKLLCFSNLLQGFSREQWPDVLLVPDLDGNEEITDTNLIWEHILWTLKFKKRINSALYDGMKKRKREASGGKAQTANTKAKMVMRSEMTASRRGSGRKSSVSSSASNPMPSTPRPDASESGMPSTEPFASSSGTSIAPALSCDSFAENLQSASCNGVPTGQESLQQFSPTEATSATIGDCQNVLISHSSVEDMISSTMSATSATSATSFYQRPPPPEIQLANHLAEVMSARGDRTHVFGALVEKTKIRLQFYSHSCGVVSDAIDIVEESDWHAVFLVLVTRQTMAKLGFNTVLGYCNPFDTADNTTLRLSQKLESIEGGGDNFTYASDTEVEYEDRVHVEYGAIGRGTTVLGVKKPPECKVDLILKASWQVKTRRHEDEAIMEARGVNSQHAPEIYGRLVIPDPSPTMALVAKCTHQPSKGAEERELRILLMRRYLPVTDLDDEKFLDVMLQIMYFTHDLYSKKSLLHRDIGIFNIVYFIGKNEEDEDWPIAVLIDYDLATFPLGDGIEQQTVHHRSGTKPFMALETLHSEGGDQYTHHYVHELESILYTCIWQGVGYKGFLLPEDGDPLRLWRRGSWEEVHDAKKKFLRQPCSFLLRINDDDLRTFCSLACAAFSRRYATITAYKSWMQFNKSSGLKKSRFADPTAVPPTPPRPPIPSKALLPAFLKASSLRGVTCMSDCCQPTQQASVIA